MLKTGKALTAPAERPRVTNPVQASVTGGGTGSPSAPGHRRTVMLLTVGLTVAGGAP